MDDETQVAAAVLQRLEDAWNAADGDAFGAPFTEDADFVDVRGAHHRSREAIARGHQHIFETIYRGSRVRYVLAQARRLTGDVILAHSSGTLDAPAGPLAGTQLATTTLVLVRAGDGWRVAAWHNTFAQA